MSKLRPYDPFDDTPESSQRSSSSSLPMVSPVPPSNGISSLPQTTYSSPSPYPPSFPPPFSRPPPTSAAAFAPAPAPASTPAPAPHSGPYSKNSHLGGDYAYSSLRPSSLPFSPAPSHSQYPLPSHLPSSSSDRGGVRDKSGQSLVYGGPPPHPPYTERKRPFEYEGDLGRVTQDRNADAPNIGYDRSYPPMDRSAHYGKNVTGNSNHWKNVGYRKERQGPYPPA